MILTDGTLDGLTDVSAPANTPTGKVLGATAVGAWGPVDGVPQIPAPAPYTYSQSGVQGAGQTVILQGYLAVHETDTQGVDHDWGTVLHAGDKVAWNGQTYTVASINTGDTTLPQVVIDNFVRSGICMVKTVEPVPAAPANGAAVGFGPAWDGKVLGVEGGAWSPVDPPVGGNGVPMDPKGIVHQWDPGTAYRAYDLVWAETDGVRYYYSSDIDQTGGASPSPTNLATWSMINGYEIMTLSSLTTASMRSLAAGMWKKWTGTQAAYDALTVKDPGTLYAVTG
jgi:hypothetical protein